MTAGDVVSKHTVHKSKHLTPNKLAGPFRYAQLKGLDCKQEKISKKLIHPALIIFANHYWSVEDASNNRPSCHDLSNFV